MASEEISIGRLAKESGTKVQTIRYYEDIGLLPPAPRTAGNQRRYSHESGARLKFIRHARELGFSLERVRDLLALSDDPDRPCAEVDSIAQGHLAEVEARISRLVAMKEELERMIHQCRGGRVADCRILEVVADHALCAHPDHSEESPRQIAKA